MESEKTERKLAAILHADVVGYSRMMGEDEVGTLAFTAPGSGYVVGEKPAGYLKNLTSGCLCL